MNWPVTRFTTGGTPMVGCVILWQTRFYCYVMGVVAINSSRYYIFKQDLQALVNELGIEIRIAHYPPYTEMPTQQLRS